MSDFLARLADRALAPQPIVQPRLQSIYEAPVVAAFNSLMEEHVEIPAETPRPPESTQETRFRPKEEQKNSKPAIEHLAREPAVPREAKSESAPQQQAIVRRNESQRLPLRKKIEPVVKIEPAKREGRATIATRKDGDPAQPAETALTNQAPTIAPHGNARADAQVRPVEPKPHPLRTQRQAEKEKTIFHESKPSAKKPVRQPTIVTVKPLPKPRDREPTVAPMTPARREGPLPAPSVHVMIGRVEIRAVTPPSPMLRTDSVSATGKLSLDEYLKRNAGGSR